jgi:hypothetical protein
MKHVWIAAGLLLVGCSHWDGITPLGPDTYMVSLFADGVDPVGTQTMAYRLAGAHCASLGREIRTVEASGLPGKDDFARPWASYDMIFRCIEGPETTMTAPGEIQSGAAVTLGKKR